MQRGVGSPLVITWFRTVDFGKGSLETVALYFFHPLGKDHRFERILGASGSRQDVVTARKLGLEKGGLIQQIVAIDVVAGHFNRQDVFPRPDEISGVPLVHTVVAVPGARGTVT